MIHECNRMKNQASSFCVLSVSWLVLKLPFPKSKCSSKAELCRTIGGGAKMRPFARWCDAFTRIELLVLLAVLGVIALLALPALANTNARSQRVICVNNLRQIGRAYQMWAGDHDDFIPPLVSANDGGTQSTLPGVNAWVQFSWISNELGSPKVLACPSDNARVARDFSSDPTGGLAYPGFRNNAVSYVLGHPMPEFPADWLCADRNLRMDQVSAGCSYFRMVAVVALRPPSANVQWTNSIHVNSGNVLSIDGRVEQLSNGALFRNLSQLVEDNGNIHLLVPR